MSQSRSPGKRHPMMVAVLIIGGVTLGHVLLSMWIRRDGDIAIRRLVQDGMLALIAASVVVIGLDRVATWAVRETFRDSGKTLTELVC